MSGFENSVMVAKNVNFDQTAPKPHLGIINAAGKLPIGTGNTFPTPEILGGSITSPDGSITVGYSSPNITIQSSGTKDLHVAKLIVNSSPNSGGNYTTITAALTAAVSGDTIFVMPGATGVYTEDLTLKAGVNITAFPCDAQTPNVTIVGNATFSSAGTVTISGIRLQTNGAAFLTVAGASVTIVNLIGCYLNCTNNTGISYSTANASSMIRVLNCQGNLTAGGIGFFSSSSTGTIFFEYCFFDNTGNSTTGDTASAGVVGYLSGYQRHSFTSSGTCAVGMNYQKIDTNGINTACWTCGGLGGTANFCAYTSGTASAISVGATLELQGSTVIYSTNVNAITGAGSLKYAPISFVTGSSTTINTVTTAQERFGPLISPVMVDTNGTVTYDGTILKTVSPGTAGQVLTSNGAGSLPSYQGLSGGGFTWVDATGATQALLAQHGYVTDHSATVVYTLPASGTLGDVIKIVGKLGLATITPNANQQILIGSVSGTVGVTGTATSNNVGDCIELICITAGASTVWRADSVIGTWTLA